MRASMDLGVRAAEMGISLVGVDDAPLSTAAGPGRAFYLKSEGASGQARALAAALLLRGEERAISAGSIDVLAALLLAGW